MPENNNELWNIYDIVKDWIKFSDAKAVAIIGINGFILSLIFSNIEIVKLITKLFILKILLILIVIFLIISIFYAIVCLYPQKTETYKNVIYYKSISEKFNSSEDYSCEVEKLITEKSLKEQLSKQIYQISTVATKKYEKVTCSLKFFSLEIILFFVLILALVIFFPDIFNSSKI